MSQSLTNTRWKRLPKELFLARLKFLQFRSRKKTDLTKVLNIFVFKDIEFSVKPAYQCLEQMFHMF